MSKKRILLIRSQDILTDSRVHRYEDWFIKNNIKYKILGWDRKNKNIVRDNTIFCRVNAGYKLGYKGIKYRIKWNIFILKYLIKNHKEYDIIHACDFDTIVPSLIMKLFKKYVIFDIFDWFSDEVKTGKKVIDLAINILEKISTKISDLTIICEEERLNQIKIMPKNYIVVPNIPNIDLNKITFDDSTKKSKIKVSYVGGLYPDRGINELLEVISNLKNIELNIAGFGNQVIENNVKNFSEKYDNIIYYGKVDYEKAINIMSKSDFIYAMYYKYNKNNIYAAPNKFYEAIFLQKPIITTTGTLVGDKVKKYKTGYVIEEGEENLLNLLKNLRKRDIDDYKIILSKYRKIYTNKYKECMDKYRDILELI